MTRRWTANEDQPDGFRAVVHLLLAETTSMASSVLSTSDQSSSNIQAVSTAADELAASIEEISGQMGRAAEMARAASGQAERSNTGIQNLAEATQKIGDVIVLIQETAEQANLIALNDTIEATRDGEAGNGFAVVAF